MQIPKTLISNTLLVVFGVAIGMVITRNSTRPMESGISVYEEGVTKSMDLLSDLSKGGEKAVKQHLESSFKISLKQINIIARQTNYAAERAKVVQKVVSKWRSDNPTISLDAELSKEIQNASTQVHQ